MDKKKLIGTIIGVALFAALIAGATYAWLTFSLNVTNGNYVYNTTDFVINYESGTPTLDGNIPTLTTPTAGAAKSMSVSAYRDEDTPNGILYLKVTSNQANYITRGGAINYAVCSGTASASDCSSLVKGQTGVLSTGAITAKKEKEETIMYQTIDPTADGVNVEDYGVGIPTVKTYYWIYFWIDPARVTEEMVEETYEGYVSASAEQR